MEQIGWYIAIGLLTKLVFLYITKKGKTPVQPLEDSYYELKLHKFYWYLGLGLVMLGGTTFILASLDGEWFIGLGFILIFAGFGSISVLWYDRHSVRFNNETIASTALFGDMTSAKWQDIASVDYTPLTGKIVFNTKNNQKIKVHQHLVGLIDLANMMESQTQFKKADLKLRYIK